MRTRSDAYASSGVRGCAGVVTGWWVSWPVDRLSSGHTYILDQLENLFDFGCHAVSSFQNAHVSAIDGIDGVYSIVIKLPPAMLVLEIANQCLRVRLCLRRN